MAQQRLHSVIERGFHGTEKKGRLAPALRWLRVQCSLRTWQVRNGPKRVECSRTSVVQVVRVDVVVEGKRQDCA